jgi:hypothetical protein
VTNVVHEVLSFLSMNSNGTNGARIASRPPLLVELFAGRLFQTLSVGRENVSAECWLFLFSTKMRGIRG